MAYDVGAHGLAQRYFTQALYLTRATGDRSLGAYILSRMSRQATYLGYAKDAVNLGSTGREEAVSHATPAAMALFWSVEARGHGLLGDSQACTAALTQAERYLNSVTMGNEPTWSSFFDEAQLCDEFAHCFSDLQKPRETIHFAQRSLQLRTSSYVRSKAFCHTVLATAYLQMGEVEEACNVAER
ncbi:MAG TPA: regulator, partial [Gammaproteobacteria bacterium]|nr:regulator [Gammaproteobacteria bacterium]